MAGCADDSGVLPPLGKEGSGGAPIRCTTPGLTVDGLLQDGSWPMVLGTIVSVEPVLDRFLRYGEDEVSDRVCKRLQDADPAIRVTIDVEDSSWEAPTNQPLTLVFDTTAFYEFSATPVLSKRGAVEWSNGGSYFPKGARILAVGGLIDSGELFTRGKNVYEITSENTIAGYRRAQCINGTLNDRKVDDVLALATKGWDGTPPTMNGEPPRVGTRCYDGDE